jgi:hypothetical protein
MQWGGPEEQAQEIASGNRTAKDWQAEALRVVEETVRVFATIETYLTFLSSSTDGDILQQ